MLKFKKKNNYRISDGCHNCIYCENIYNSLDHDLMLFCRHREAPYHLPEDRCSDEEKFVEDMFICDKWERKIISQGE